jgi:excinuclease ABC subunit B
LPFELVSTLVPAGDQPRAIDELTAGLVRGDKFQTLLVKKTRPSTTTSIG